MEQQRKGDGLEIQRGDAAASEQAASEGEGGSLLPMPVPALVHAGRFPSFGQNPVLGEGQGLLVQLELPRRDARSRVSGVSPCAHAGNAER